MADAHHKFDISLIPRVLSVSAPDPGTGSAGGPKSGYGIPETGSANDPKSGRGIGEPEMEVLRAFQGSPEWQPHVVDLAREARLEFDDALKGVLRLVARGDLNLRQRDTVANDHLVSLTPKGEAVLRHVFS
jgi:hypothetical protein